MNPIQAALKEKPCIIMGVLNITPDSFSDGGQFNTPEKAIARAEQMLAEGAALIDIGAESTRPGSKAVPEAEELSRLLPVVRALKKNSSMAISIDTKKPHIMQVMLDEGVDMINDVNALKAEGAIEVLAPYNAMIGLMHMQGMPENMQDNPYYQDVLQEVYTFLQQRIEALLTKGIARERLCIDPGFGFGKTVTHNLMLLKHLSSFKSLNLPLLVGLSRKSFIEKLLHLPVDERLFPSVACAVMSAAKGANIIRTHDVKATAQAIAMVNFVEH